MKRLGVSLLPLDGMLVHRRVAPAIKSITSPFYTLVEGGTYLRQNSNPECSIHRANTPSQGTYPFPSYTVGVCVCCTVPLQRKSPSSGDSSCATGLSSRETKHSSRETKALKTVSQSVEKWFRSLYGDFFSSIFVLTFPVFNSVVFLVYSVIVFIRCWLAEKQKHLSSVTWEKNRSK